MKKFIVLTSLLLAVILLAGCGKEKSVLNGNGGIYKSIDGGEVFHLSSKITEGKNLSGASILNLVISPVDSNIIYAGTAKHGIYRSSNGGETWAESKSDFTLVRKIVLHPTDQNIIYIVAESKGERALFKSIDGGINWRKLLAQRNKEQPLTIDVAIDPINPDTLYASDSTGGVFKTTNGGEEWAPIYWAESPVKNVVVDLKNPQQIYVVTTEDEIIVSHNGGQNFEEGAGMQGRRPISEQAEEEIVTPENTQKNEVIHSADERRKRYGKEKVELSEAEKRAMLSNKKRKVISRENYSVSNIYSVAISPSEKNVFYILSENGLDVTRDGGETFEKIETLLKDGEVVAHKIVVDPNNKNILYLVDGKILYKTYNGGETWAPTPLKISWPVKSFVIDSTNSNNIYMGLAAPPKEPFFLLPF